MLYVCVIDPNGRVLYVGCHIQNDHRFSQIKHNVALQLPATLKLIFKHHNQRKEEHNESNQTSVQKSRPHQSE